MSTLTFPSKPTTGTNKFSEPACTASYFGLFQTDLAIKFWFNLLRGETKIQEQVPSGSQGEPAFPEELK